MSNRLRQIRDSPEYAYIAPLAVFLLCLMPVGPLRIEHEDLPWYRHSPEQWIYPLQTLICLGLLVFFRRHYVFRPYRGLGLAVVLGVATIAVWILPAWLYHPLGVADSSHPKFWEWLGVAERLDGFDPGVFAANPAAYWAAVVMRFIRMVVVVPLVEEIFWRGFLMRWLVDTDRPFTETPFGTYRFKAVAITTAMFMLAHSPVDYLGALVFGLAMAWLAIRTKSLAACVLMHAVANLLLGIYVMVTKQWGFW